MKLLVCLVGLSVGKNINVNDIKRKLVLPCVKMEGPLVDGRLIADGRKEAWKQTPFYLDSQLPKACSVLLQ